MPTLTLPKLPKAEELYNSIMEAIEPELTTSQIPVLKQKYVKETATEKAARLKRYDQAFAAYDKAQEAYLKELTSKVDVFRKQALGEAERTSKKEEQEKLATIETLFSH